MHEMMRRGRLVDFVCFFLSAFAILLLLSSSSIGVQAQEDAAGDNAEAGEQTSLSSYTCEFSAPLQLDLGVRLEHFKNEAAGTFTMRLTYTGGLSWVSIGVNTEGGTKMIPGTAIIGRMLYEEDEITPLGSSVLKYDLVTDDEDGDGVVAMDDKLQTLMDATFEQNYSSDEEEEVEGGTSILTFTQKLDDVGLGIDAITDETSWIYAIGLPDNEWEGRHTVHGSFYLRLEDNCIQVNVNDPAAAQQEPEVITDDPSHGTGPGETSVGIPDDVNDEDEDDQPVTEPETEQPPADETNTTTSVENPGAVADEGGDDEGQVEEPVPVAEPVVNYECSFVEPREIWVDKVMLEHYKNTEAGTYTMRVTYLVGSAWVGIGVNHEGSFKMSPSTCIIGRIEYAEDGVTPIGSSVLKYDVTNTDKDASGVIAMADELQTLMDATFEQDGETSVLMFTQKLDDVGLGIEAITDETSWIYAVGLPDNQWEGSHKIHGSFFMPLEDNCTVAGAAEEGAAPVVQYECSYVAPRELWVDKVQLEHYKNTEAGTYTMRLTYLVGSAWVSIGVNHEGSFKMSPSTCIIGRIEYDEDGITPIGSSVLKYDVTNTDEDASGVALMADEFQTLINATFEQDGETSVLTFTQKLDDSGMNGPITDETRWIYAVGLPENQWDGSHKLHGSFFLPLEENCAVVKDENDVESAEGSDSESGIVMRQNAAESTFPLWAAHGWIMAVAWGLVGPLAIGAAILRRLVGSSWYKIHFYTNMLCVILTMVGFILAVVATNMEQKPHFTRKSSQDDYEQVHHNAGLVICVIVILQSVAGYFRPPAAPAAAPAPVAEQAKKLDDDDEQKPNDDEQKPNLRRGYTRMTTPTDETFHLRGQIGVGNSVVLDGTPSGVEAQHQSPPKALSKDTSGDLEGTSSDESKAMAGVPVEQKPKSPWIRKMWEIQHRLTGAVVVGLAWYNCHSGYLLMEDNYDERQNFSVVFWSVAGAVVGSVFILAYAARV